MTITMWNQGFQKVAKSDFDTFIAFYPRKLERHLVTFGEPPLLMFNDFTIGKYPESIVAGKYCREDDGGQDEYWVSHSDTP